MRCLIFSEVSDEVIYKKQKGGKLGGEECLQSSLENGNPGKTVRQYGVFSEVW